jgi:hypothetical protein
VIVCGRCHRHLDSCRPVVSQPLFAAPYLGSYEKSKQLLAESLRLLKD